MRHADRAQTSLSPHEPEAGNPFSLAEAERHLAAFHQAVLKMHGAQEAQQAAEDWLRECAAAAEQDTLIRWGHVTAAAASRLAARLVDGKNAASRDRPWRMIKHHLCCAVSGH